MSTTTNYYFVAGAGAMLVADLRICKAYFTNARAT